MNCAARFTGSSSVCDALKASSASLLVQRVMLRPCHLLSLAATSHETNWLRNVSGSGCVIVVVYICRSQPKCGKVSQLATSEEKNTDAVTAFTSMSMPAFWQACFTIAWVFWRGVLIEVW